MLEIAVRLIVIDPVETFNLYLSCLVFYVK